MIRYESIINKRMETCKACPIYNHTFNSCGKPIIQKLLNVFNDPVVLDGKEFRPCGCHMPTKSRFTLFDCPAGKWEPVVERSLKNDLLNIANTIKKKGTASLEDRRNLQAIYNSAMGTKVDITTVGCSQCVRNILDSIEMEMKDAVSGVDIVQDNSEDITLQDLIEQKIKFEETGEKPKRKSRTKKKPL